ncbi:hypothetical protein TNCV_3021101 [Trichonephila clavipes]|nr:hypothetical protein TNCV_3021101 [Trichonephila clavipes]
MSYGQVTRKTPERALPSRNFHITPTGGGGKVFLYLSLFSPCFTCSSSELLGHLPGTVVWRSRPGLRHSYTKRSNGLDVSFPAPREFETTTSL